MRFIQLSVLLTLLSTQACVHQTSMNDPKLRDFWNGKSLSELDLADATQRWPDDATLIEMQEAFTILRKDVVSKDDRKMAKNSLSKAAASFEDLKQPNNFSSAFTIDSKTPYRGRPYERVLANIFLGILDVADGRCDMALPAFKSAEFLDARWQPFDFGSDAPLIYALTLRCLKENNSSANYINRAREGLFRAIRMGEILEDIRLPLDQLAKSYPLEEPGNQISFLILDAGISASLMESPIAASSKDILANIISDSLRFYVQVLANKDDYMHDTIAAIAQKLERRFGSSDKSPSAQSLVYLESVLKEIISTVDRKYNLTQKISEKLVYVGQLTEEIDRAVSKPKITLLFSGKGPKVISEGQYGEIARILPSSERDAKPDVVVSDFVIPEKCGFHHDNNGVLRIVLCNSDSLVDSNIQKSMNRKGIKLWSSSYQATSMVGRRFDKVLRGRAQFRLGTDSASQIAAATALTLLDEGNRLERNCRLYGTDCESAKNLQLAGALAGVFAGAAWFTGQMVNPKADTRHLTHAYESGYLILDR